MERTRRDTVCSTSSYGCESTLTRFVWAGDQLLWELRVPGGNDVVGSGLESTSASGDVCRDPMQEHDGALLTRIVEVQLTGTFDPVRLKEFADLHLRVKGALVHQAWGTEYTPVVMRVDSIPRVGNHTNTCCVMDGEE